MDGFESEYRSAVFNGLNLKYRMPIWKTTIIIWIPIPQRLRRMLVEPVILWNWQLFLHTLDFRVCDFAGDSDTNKPSITFAIHGNELIVELWVGCHRLSVESPEERSALNQFQSMVCSYGESRWQLVVDASSSPVPRQKNGRNTDGMEPYAYEGVDISANFPTMHPEPGLELESETIALMELLDKSNTISLLSLHTGGHGWYTPDLTKDSTGVMTDLIDGFTTDLVPVLEGADVKRLRPNSDLGEVRWFFENYHFPAFIFEYPKDLAPMDHLEREVARNNTLLVLQKYWGTLQSKAFVRGVVMDQNGDPIEDATLHLPQSLSKEFTWSVSEEGDFAILLPSHDVYSLKIRAEGYVDAQKKIDVRKGTGEVRIVLQQKDIEQ